MHRICLDQNVPQSLGTLLPGHDVKSTAELGWSELSNGALLAAAEGTGFDVLITADQNLQYQQSIKHRSLAVVVLSTNHWPTLQAEAPRILEALERATKGSYHDVVLTRQRPRKRPPRSP